ITAEWDAGRKAAEVVHAPASRHHYTIDAYGTFPEGVGRRSLSSLQNSRGNPRRVSVFHQLYCVFAITFPILQFSLTRIELHWPGGIKSSPDIPPGHNSLPNPVYCPRLTAK